MSIILGIDVGGSGIKGAPVDLSAGDFAQSRVRIPTPQKSTPKNVAAVIAEIIEEFKDKIGDNPVGITIPAPVVHGRIPFIANLDQKWAGLEADKYLEDTLGRPITLVNDADGAGLAEVHFGAAKGHPGLVIMTTLGTGIGTAIIYRGVLIPNAELGHIEMFGKDAEPQAAASVKDREELSYETWATERLQPYYERLEFYTWPDLIVVGGGVSKASDKFLPLLKLKTPIVPAKLRNAAGIVGAAWLAVDELANPDALKEGASGSAKGGKKKSGKGKKG